jgi:death-on-curing protein
MESLANNHPFIDGNKRIAFTLTDTFLTANGYVLLVESMAANSFIRDAMARHEFRFPFILNWIRDHVRAIDLL